MILEGLFLFSSMIYNGTPMPVPNPKLVMTFEFTADGRDRLHYYREDETGFCERDAVFNFDGEHLLQQVTWVNPQNADFCSTDPDMVFGKESINRANVSENQFHLIVQMGDEDLTLVWEKKQKPSLASYSKK